MYMEQRMDIVCENEEREQCDVDVVQLNIIELRCTEKRLRLSLLDREQRMACVKSNVLLVYIWHPLRSHRTGLS